MCRYLTVEYVCRSFQIEEAHQMIQELAMLLVEAAVLQMMMASAVFQRQCLM